MRRTREILRGGALLGALMLLGACASAAAPRAAPGPAGAAVSGVALIAAGAANPAPIVSGTLRPYQIRGRWYRPAENPRYDETGLASWYGDAFHGRPTATGERFDMHAMTAAHKTLPLPALVEVTNLETGQALILRVNDRGPFVDGRIIDLSRAAANELGLLNRGVGRVRVRYMGRAPRLDGGPVRYASTAAPAPAAAPVSRAVPYTSLPPAVATSTTVARPYASVPPAVAPATLPAGTVLPPATPAEIVAGAPAPLPIAVWVQAGAFASRPNAEAAARALGERARIEPTNGANGTLYRVMVGPLDDIGQAQRVQRAAAALGYDDAMVVSRR